MNQTTEPFIQIRNLHKSYGDLKVLRGINLEIPPGEMVSVIGPSGSGKSTLLRVLMTLERPERGGVRVGGEPLYDVNEEGATVLPSPDRFRALRNRIGMVFQHFNLFPHISVLRNVTEAPVHVLGLPRAEAKAEGLRYLDEVGLADKADAYPAQLSGGQKQRVAIARALAMSPKLMLFDEPTSALDPELIGEVLEVMVRLAKEGMTMLVVSHEMGFARTVADEIIFMEGGIILEQASPETMFRAPQHKRTVEFLRKISDLYGETE